MLDTTVTTIDDWNGRVLGGDSGGLPIRVAKDDGVSVAA